MNSEEKNTKSEVKVTELLKITPTFLSVKHDYPRILWIGFISHTRLDYIYRLVYTKVDGSGNPQFAIEVLREHVDLNGKKTSIWGNTSDISVAEVMQKIALERPSLDPDFVGIENWI